MRVVIPHRRNVIFRGYVHGQPKTDIKPPVSLPENERTSIGDRLFETLLCYTNINGNIFNRNMHCKCQWGKNIFRTLSFCALDLNGSMAF
jgi:hypothetical protein